MFSKKPFPFLFLIWMLFSVLFLLNKPLERAFSLVHSGFSLAHIPLQSDDDDGEGDFDNDDGDNDDSDNDEDDDWEDGSNEKDFLWVDYSVFKRPYFVFQSIQDYKQGVAVEDAIQIQVASNTNYVLAVSTRGVEGMAGNTSDQLPVSTIKFRVDKGNWKSLDSDWVVLLNDPHSFNKGNGNRHPSAPSDCYIPELNDYKPCRTYMLDYGAKLNQLYADGTYEVDMTYVLTKP